MVRETVSRRSLLAAATGTAVGVAGCTGNGSCQTVFDGVEEIEGGGMLVYDVEATAGQRLYLDVRRQRGSEAAISVFDPAEEPIVRLEDVAQLERVIDLTETGTHAVVARNESGGTSGRWALTVAVYRGWCADVF